MWLGALLLFLPLSFGLWPLTFAANAAPRPDLVIFLTDDQSQLDCTPYGGAGMRTPNMQKLADAAIAAIEAAGGSIVAAGE